MSTTAAPRRRGGVLVTTLALVAALVLLARAYDARLARIDHATGYLLFLVVLALAALGMRKKLATLPLGTAAGWLRWHLGLGLVAVVLAALHAGLAPPKGTLEILLWLSFVTVTLSGLLGLFVSRSFAPRLATRGQEVIWERIPALRARIREEAEGVVRRSQSELHSTAVADTYEAHVAAFLSRPANFISHVFGSGRPVKAILDTLEAQNRYANEAERELTRELRELVVMKDDLDFHWALQSVLKGWLFLHVPATSVLLLLALAHGLLAEAFAFGTMGGGAP